MMGSSEEKAVVKVGVKEGKFGKGNVSVVVEFVIVGCQLGVDR